MHQEFKYNYELTLPAILMEANAENVDGDDATKNPFIGFAFSNGVLYCEEKYFSPCLFNFTAIYVHIECTCIISYRDTGLTILPLFFSLSAFLFWNSEIDLIYLLSLQIHQIFLFMKNNINWYSLRE